MATAGCSDPRFEEAQFARSQRIHSLFARIEPRRERGIDNIHQLGSLHRQLEANRSDHLHRTFDLVEGRETRRADDWRAGDKQRQWRDLFLHGQTDRLDDTYAKMFY